MKTSSFTKSLSSTASGNTKGKEHGEQLPKFDPISGVSTRVIPENNEIDDSPISLGDPWRLYYVTDVSSIIIPRKLFFQDYKCTKPLPNIDLSNWPLCKGVFELLRQYHYDSLQSIYFHHCMYFKYAHFQMLRGCSKLKHLSIQNCTSYGTTGTTKNNHSSMKTLPLVITMEYAEIISSFKQLRSLSFHDCIIGDYHIWHIFANTLPYVKTLSIVKCINLNNFCLHEISLWIRRYGQMNSLNLSYNLEFSDEGLLDILSASLVTGCINELQLIGCTQITSLGLTGLRMKTNNTNGNNGNNNGLLKLNFNYFTLDSNGYDYLTETNSCRNLISLQLMKNFHLLDHHLLAIGKACQSLQRFNLSHCYNITNQGIISFFNMFHGYLTHLNLSNCLQLNDFALMAIVNCGNGKEIIGKYNIQHLQELQLNGLAKITSKALILFFQTNGYMTLQLFEMCCELKSTILHRKSMIPHLSDEVLLSFPLPLPHQEPSEPLEPSEPPEPVILSQLHVIKLIGCNLISDQGMIHFLSIAIHLISLDISYCIAITDATIVILAQYATQLSELNLTACVHISNISLQYIGNTQYTLCTTLEELSLSGCHQINDKGIQYLANCHKLSILNIRSCDLITNTGLSAVFRGCPKLKTIDIMNLDEIDISCIKILLVHCPYLTTLYADGCNITASEFHNELIPSKKITTVVTSNTTNKKEKEKMSRRLSQESIGRKMSKTMPTTSSSSSSQVMTKTTSINPSSSSFFPLADIVMHHCQCKPRASSIITYNTYVIHLLQLQQAIRVIQRFTKAIKSFKFQRITKALRLNHLKRLQIIFNTLKNAIKVQRKESFHENYYYAVIQLQCKWKQLYAIYLAKRKLRMMRLHYSATRCIQTLFRGYITRKQQYRRVLQPYYTQKICFQQLIWKAWLIVKTWYPFKLTINHLIARVRRYLAYKKYHRLYHMVLTLQYKHRYKHHKADKQAYRWQLQQQQEALALQRQQFAARLICKNVKAFRFNNMMSSYILYCCMVYSNDTQAYQDGSQVIQRYYRGYSIRKKTSQMKLLQAKTQHATQIITKQLLRYHYQHQYSLKRQRWARIQHYYTHFFLISMPRLRLNVYVKRIQQRYRVYRYHCLRITAATTIQRAYRHYKHQKERGLELYEQQMNSMVILQRNWHIWHARKQRKAQIARNHMAAYRIYLAVEKFFAVERKKKVERNLILQQRDQIKTKKQIALDNIYNAKIAKAEEKFHYFQAKKIQTCWRAYVAYKKSLLTSRKWDRSGSMKSLSSAGTHQKGSGSKAGGGTSTKSSWKHGSSTDGGGRRHDNENDDKSEQQLSPLAKLLSLPVVDTMFLAPARVMGGALKAIGKVLAAEELVPSTDMKKFTNAVLKYQVKTILQEGVIDLHLTLGERETKAFQQNQNQLKSAKLPYFECLQEDLSGGMNLEMYLWKMEGTGKDCLTKLIIDLKPPYLSNEGMRSRQENLYTNQFIKLIWHPSIHFEIQAYRSMKMGQAEFAIQELSICTNPLEHDNYYLNGYMLIKHLNEVGIQGISLFCKMRKIDEDENQLYRLNRIAAQEWCNERLLKTAKTFLLHENDIFSIYRIFASMLYGRNRDSLAVEELFHALKFPYNRLSRWIIAAITPISRHELIFSEYLHFLSYFIMLTSKELTRFLFQHADEDNRGFLRRDQFTKLVELLAEGSVFNVKAWEKQWEQFHDKKLKFQFISNFEQFTKQNPGVLWKPQALQQQLMEHNLGKRYWNDKLEQFRLVRENLGIKLM